MRERYVNSEGSVTITHAEHVRGFIAVDGSLHCVECSKSYVRVHTALDRAMIRFDNVVEIFDLANRDGGPMLSVLEGE